MQVTDKVTLNLSGEELFAPIFARQGDLNSRIVEATLQFDEALYEIPENTKVVVTYRSANGKSDIHDGAVSGANTVTFPLIPILLSAPGRARCDVELYNSGDMLGTGLLYVDVTPIAAKSGALETAPMYQTFVDAIADMVKKDADVDEAINNANTAAGTANNAAQNANEKAAAAQAAADAASAATSAANTAAGAANTAAGSANTAAESASSAATRATTAAEEAEKVIADISGEINNIVDTKISEQKGQPNGIASLNGSGKLAQMPTAADVGARPNTWLPKPADIGAMPQNAIEGGSNSNGSWIKYPDGTMIQWGGVEGTPNNNGLIKGTFPVAFTAAPKIVPAAIFYNATTYNAALGAVSASTYEVYISNGSTPVTSGKQGCFWVAIGRWK